jgi:hypothetical protein
LVIHREIRKNTEMRFCLLIFFALSLSAAIMAEDYPTPSLSGPPGVTDAPGRGIQADVSGHSAVMPTVYQLDAQPIEQISPLVQRQMLNGTQSTLVKWTVKKGGVSTSLRLPAALAFRSLRPIAPQSSRSKA